MVNGYGAEDDQDMFE